jgi:FkbH-like protein
MARPAIDPPTSGAGPEGPLAAARSLRDAGDTTGALEALVRVVDGPERFTAWASAAALLDKLTATERPPARRTARLAVLGTYTVSQLVALLRLAALRAGLDLAVYEAPFGQLEQELLDEDGALHRFEPDFVLIAAHEGALRLPELSAAPEDDVAAELDRWRGLWRLAGRSGARVVQHTFAVRPEVAEGHLSARLPGSRYAMTLELNRRLGLAAGDDVSLVDCERLAGWLGKDRWFDDRYWHLSRQAVALDALPLLARHTSAVLAAAAGVARRCLVCDLDNTLWGGVIGEDGLDGIRLGAGRDGEAFVAFQRHLLRLRRAGVILAVVSKNNESDAREPFEEHPDMQLRLDDVAVFVAGWDDKATGLRRVAATLGLGLDALVFVDDDPVERALVRSTLPEVDVVELPPEPSEYVRALARYPLLEPLSLTPEDSRRAALYRMRGEAAALEASAATLDDFLAGLGMEAQLGSFDELHLPRAAQLVAKTNQFNLATRRHSAARLRAFMEDPGSEAWWLRLRDRFGDHGLVGVLVARQRGETLEVDTWLLSCRVIGRGVEQTMLAHLCRRAAARGCTRLEATYVPTARNGPVADLLPRLGFAPVAEDAGQSTWRLDLAARRAVASPFIAETGPPRDDA